MGAYPPNCTVKGTGPFCDLGERGDAFRAQCLVDAKAQIIGRFYDCMAACAPNAMMEGNMGGLRGSAALEKLDGCSDLLSAQGDTSLYVNAKCKSQCFRGIDGAQDLKRCYCRTITCEFCIGTPTTPGGIAPVEPTNPNPPPTEPGSPGVVTPTPPAFPTLRVVASAYNLPIPVVYGRALITGNIIWVGNKRTGEETFRYLEGDTPQAETVRYGIVDLAVGLTDKRVAGVARIYFDDQLVFSNLFSATGARGVLNLSALGVNDTDHSQPRGLITSFELFSAGENQRVNRRMPQEHPIAYRGLTYIYIANFSTSKNGASLPNIKVEVTEVATEAYYPTLTSALAPPDFVFSQVSDAFVHVDHTQGRMTTLGVGLGGTSLAGSLSVSYTDLTHRLSFNPLSQLVIDAPLDISPTALYIAKNGALIYQAGATSVRRKTYAVFPHNPSTQLVYGADDNLTTAPGATTLWNIANPRGVVADDALVNTESGGPTHILGVGQGRYLTFMKIGLEDGVFAPFTTVDFGANNEIVSVRYYTWNLRESVGLVSGFAVVYRESTIGLKVAFFPSYTTTTGARFRGTLADATTITITPGTWGGVDNIVNNVYLDSANPGLHIIMRTRGTYRHFKTKDLTSTVAFPAVLLTHAPPPNHKMRHFPLGDITWLDGTTVRSISRETGAVKTFALPGTVPPLTGVQYYDPKTNVLNYTSGGNIAKLFLSRVEPLSVPLTRVLEDIMTRSGLSADQYTFNGLDLVQVKGYLITDSPTTRGVLDLLAQFYSLSVLESGGRITIASKATTPPEIVIPASHTILEGDSVQKVNDVAYSDRDLVTSVIVTYLDEDAMLGIRYQTAAKDILEDDPAFVDRYVKVELAGPIVLDKDEARRLAEKTLLRVLQRSRKRTFVLGPRYWYIDPDDYVTLNEAA